MQNDGIRNQYESFSRIENFGRKYAIDFSPTSRGGRDFAKIGMVVAEMEENGVKQLSGSGELTRSAAGADRGRRISGFGEKPAVDEESAAGFVVFHRGKASARFQASMIFRDSGRDRRKCL